jgi:hypothetical protein
LCEKKLPKSPRRNFGSLKAKKPASDSTAEETDAAPVQPLDPRHHGRLSWAFLGPGWALSRSWSPVFFPNDESEIMNDEMTDVSDFIFSLFMLHR